MITIDKAAVRQTLAEWFIQAREGKGLSARETAELSADEAAASVSDWFYAKLAELAHQPEEPPAKKPIDDGPSLDITMMEFVCGEDLAAGQIVVPDPSNPRRIIGKPDDPFK